MIGPLAVIIGLLGIWALARGKAGPVLEAIQKGFSTSLEGVIDLNPAIPTSGGPATNPNSGGISHSVNNATFDIGSHMGLDASGLVVTIDKTYQQMSDTEKDAANKFARLIGNKG